MVSWQQKRDLARWTRIARYKGMRWREGKLPLMLLNMLTSKKWPVGGFEAEVWRAQNKEEVFRLVEAQWKKLGQTV